MAANSRQSRCEYYVRTAREIEQNAKIDRLQSTTDADGSVIEG